MVDEVHIKFHSLVQDVQRNVDRRFRCVASAQNKAGMSRSLDRTKKIKLTTTRCILFLPDTHYSLPNGAQIKKKEDIFVMRFRSKRILMQVHRVMKALADENVRQSGV
jgi:hypothetical protein